MRSVVSLIVSSFLLLSSYVYSAQFEIDTAHSSVQFRIRHLVSKTKGVFSDFKGNVAFDPKNKKSLKTNVVIHTKSIDTDNKKRDDHLRSEDFFNAEKYPEITFQSTGVVPSSAKSFKLKGNLTMHGVTKPVVLDVEYGGMAKDPWGNERVGFTGTTKVNRKDFGLTWNKAIETGGFLLGDDVEISIEVEAIKKES